MVMGVQNDDKRYMCKSRRVPNAPRNVINWQTKPQSIRREASPPVEADVLRINGDPMTAQIKLSDIAPCGMNCRLCIGYVRAKNKCDGCLTANTKCSRKCVLRLCTKRKSKYCGSCASFPCRRLKQLDKRYRTKYGMSMIENLVQIEELGIRQFVKNENTRWLCATCGELVCVHRPNCLSCGTVRDR